MIQSYLLSPQLTGMFSNLPDFTHIILTLALSEVMSNLGIFQVT